MGGPGAVRGLRRHRRRPERNQSYRFDERGIGGHERASNRRTRRDTISAGDQTIAALRRITVEQLLHLGKRPVVYLKSGMHGGEPAFVVYGADGIPLVMVDDVATAVEMLTGHGLGIVTVH